MKMFDGASHVYTINPSPDESYGIELQMNGGALHLRLLYISNIQNPKY